MWPVWGGPVEKAARCCSSAQQPKPPPPPQPSLTPPGNKGSGGREIKLLPRSALLSALCGSGRGAVPTV